jgi:hypothetical protein
VALLKIDVEGSEGLVLEGMSRTLAEAPPRTIILEATEDASIPPARLVSHLKDRGYRAQLIHPVDGPVGLDRFDGHYGNLLFLWEPGDEGQ